jgi:phenylalanyl-tRNA synthetase alpha chain
MDSFPPIANSLWQQFQDELSQVLEVSQLQNLRDKYLSRQKGLVSLQLRQLGAVSREQRPQMGKALNKLRYDVERALEVRLEKIQAKDQTPATAQVDVTLPAKSFNYGSIHPLRLVRREMEDICVRMGFEIIDGPEVETEYYNFDALNIPEMHPARAAQDTFYLKSGDLLRTHTSPMQIRTMENREPPIRIVVPGRVFRRDSVDATHSPMFHQLEALVVGEKICFSDLKGMLEVFLRSLFSPSTKVRMRPSYFPFVEPGAEVDISCPFCSGDGCRICKRSGWVEILGAGMVHPKLFDMVGYQPGKYTGFAWGVGIDRIAVLKYQVNDMRLFFENDMRFLRQF